MQPSQPQDRSGLASRGTFSTLCYRCPSEDLNVPSRSQAERLVKIPGICLYFKCKFLPSLLGILTLKNKTKQAPAQMSGFCLVERWWVSELREGAGVRVLRVGRSVPVGFVLRGQPVLAPEETGCYSTGLVSEDCLCGVCPSRACSQVPSPFGKDE